MPHFNQQLKDRENTNKEWLSHQMQNDVANDAVLVVPEQIVIEVRENKIYAILVDECTDVTGNKLMIVVFRYVNSLSGKISERTMVMVKVDNTNSQMLFDTVARVLARVKLDMKQYRVQEYDGATNMSGRKTRLVATVKINSTLEFFTQYCNHRLNLVVQKIGINVDDY